MGQSAFVNSPFPASAAVKAPRSLRLKFDVPLLLITIALIVIGMLFVFSASWQYASLRNQPSTYLLVRQIMFAGIGSVIAIILSLFDYHRYQRLLIPMVVIILVALGAVLIVKDEVNGNVRTLASGSIQPSEFSKLAVIIYLSFWLYAKRDVINNFSFGLLPLALILGVFMGLILGEPDISAAATIFVLGAVLFFLAGGELRQIVLVMVAAGLVGLAVVSLSHTGQQRMTDFFNGLQDPAKSSDHVVRSIEAIVRGGPFGVGIGRSVTKFTGLPVPWTDSIFAVITEETGFVGALTLIMLYIALLWRGLQIARKAPDDLGRLLASGITIWITFEALINMGQMVNLVPFAGNALPLISYGGSSIVSVMAGIGILMNVARSSAKDTATADGRSYSAVVDLRRGDRRRRVSRPRGPEDVGE
jgi:cell division protein FtsW